MVWLMAVKSFLPSQTEMAGFLDVFSLGGLSRVFQASVKARKLSVDIGARRGTSATPFFGTLDIRKL